MVGLLATALGVLYRASVTVSAKTSDARHTIDVEIRPDTGLMSDVPMARENELGARPPLVPMADAPHERDLDGSHDPWAPQPAEPREPPPANDIIRAPAF